MATAKVITSYATMADGDLDNFAQVVHNSLTGNAYFTFTNNELTTLQTLIADYTAKLEASATGAKGTRAAKDAARKLLLTQIKIIATLVNVQANGDVVKLESSGLQMAKERTPVGVYPKPTGFTVTSGNNSGELYFDVDRFDGVKVNMFYYTPSPGKGDIKEWPNTPSTTKNVNVGGFTPGQKIDCACAYKGAAEQLVFSDIISIYVQ